MTSPRRAVILCPNHTGLGEAIAVNDEGHWETPLGRVPIDAPLARDILERCPKARVDDRAHGREHSLEVQVPFLQYFRPDLTLTPMVISHLSFKSCRIVGEALAAADELAAEDVFAEVIDLATLKPLDLDTILGSVAKTRRCVVVSEAPRTCSFASEVSANVSEQGLMSLLAPVERVTAWDTVTPMSRLESRYMPDKRRIVAAAHKVMQYH